MGIRKNDCDGGTGEGAGHYREGHWGWAASHTFVLWIFKGGSHICFGSVFLNIPALLVVIFLMRGILNEKKTQVIGYSILRFDIIYSYQKKRHTSSLR
jgi:hypothetical protein